MELFILQSISTDNKMNLGLTYYQLIPWWIVNSVGNLQRGFL